MRLQGTTVLLVEDDADNLELLQTYLEGEGARVLAASSLRAAVTAAQGAHIDVLIADLDLPDGDGATLLEALNRRLGKDEIPAIAMSGYSQTQWRERAVDSGFCRYAVKPFAITQLVAWVAELSGAAVEARQPARAAGCRAADARRHR